MFIKTGEIKKLMKAALKGSGLYIGNVDDHYLVHSVFWGVYVERECASNKFKAAITELIGNLPEREEYKVFQINDSGMTAEDRSDTFRDPYQDWARAKDIAVSVPICLNLWPHEFAVYQRASDRGFVVVNRSITDAVLSQNELDPDEPMPGNPNVSQIGVLYYKNDRMIYWAYPIDPGDKVKKTILDHLAGLDFFEEEWVPKDMADDTKEPADEQLQY